MQLAEKQFNGSFFRRLFGRTVAVVQPDNRPVPPLHITEQERVEVFKALADETRLSIVQKLIQEGCAVASCDILSCASVHKLSQPAMSHHFGKLVEAGVITESKLGTQKLYAVNRPLLEAVGIRLTTLS